MYVLQAVIARPAVLAEIASRIVPIGQDFALLPLRPGVDEATLAEWSAHGALAFVDAEFFGGWGTQTAQVWEHGQLVLGPLSQDEDDPEPETTPISQALRRLGVVKGEHHDEFDAVALGRHRHTEDWLTAQA